MSFATLASAFIFLYGTTAASNALASGDNTECIKNDSYSLDGAAKSIVEFAILAGLAFALAILVNFREHVLVIIIAFLSIVLTILCNQLLYRDKSYKLSLFFRIIIFILAFVVFITSFNYLQGNELAVVASAFGLYTLYAIYNVFFTFHIIKNHSCDA